jgi:hypothetical protein
MIGNRYWVRPSGGEPRYGQLINLMLDDAIGIFEFECDDVGIAGTAHACDSHVYPSLLAAAKDYVEDAETVLRSAESLLRAAEHAKGELKSLKEVR